MKVGYCVLELPELASFRLRVAIPAPHIGLPYRIGATGDVSFFYKDGQPELARQLPGAIVYDVVNDHFASRRSYREMCDVAAVITCASAAMAEIIHTHTGRHAVVIDDPYETPEREAACDGDAVAWFGHGANIGSLRPYLDVANLVVCSNVAGAVPWSLATEANVLQGCAVVLLTGSNRGASSNRLVKALRAGRFVVTPGGVEAWNDFADYCWIGDVHEGIEWALSNREQACRKVQAGQERIRLRYSPQEIGKQWGNLFVSISAAVTSASRAG